MNFKILSSLVLLLVLFVCKPSLADMPSMPSMPGGGSMPSGMPDPSQFKPEEMAQQASSFKDMAASNIPSPGSMSPQK